VGKKRITFEKSSKDFYGRQNIKITIGKEEIEIPEDVVSDFIKDKEILKSSLTVRED